MEFRKLDENDWDIVTELFDKLKEYVTKTTINLEFNDNKKRDFISSPTCYSVGVFDDGKLVGFGVLNSDTFRYARVFEAIRLPRDDSAEIDLFYFLPEYIKEKTLYEVETMLFEEAKKRNLRNLISFIHPDNATAELTLKKLGMRPSIYMLKYFRLLRQSFYMQIY